MTAIRVQFTRWLYQHGRPNRLARIRNRVSALHFSSGKPLTFPLVFEHVAAPYPVFHVTHDPSPQTGQPAAVRAGSRLLGAGLILLGTAVAAVAVLGPLVSGVLRYRTSPTSLNQIIGGDAAALAVVAPVTVAVGVLALRGHPAAPVLALAPSIFVVYTYTQLILGNEFLRWPGNVERFFPLMLAVFVLAAALALRAWHSTPAQGLPATPARADRTAGIVLVAIAVFVVVGLHLPTFVDAMRDRPSSVQYLSSPTAFWLVKFVDLGIVVPAALAVGISALRRRQWARKPMYAMVGAYTLIGSSVTGMAITMTARNDPDASAIVVAGSVLMTALLAGVTCHLYRPLFRRHPARFGAPPAGPAPPTNLETSTA